MLEKYFVKPQTVDRVRACWIGAEIERYVEWLCARICGPHGVAQGSRSWWSSVRSPVLAVRIRWRTYRFTWMRLWRSGLRSNTVGIPVVTTNEWAGEVRGPIEQLLEAGRCRLRRPRSTASTGLHSPTRCRGSSST